MGFKFDVVNTNLTVIEAWVQAGQCPSTESSATRACIKAHHTPVHANSPLTNSSAMNLVMKCVNMAESKQRMVQLNIHV